MITKTLLTCFSVILASLLLLVAYVLSAKSNENIIFTLLFVNLALLVVYFPFHLILPVPKPRRSGIHSGTGLPLSLEEPFGNSKTGDADDTDPGEIFFADLRRELGSPISSPFPFMSRVGGDGDSHHTHALPPRRAMRSPVWPDAVESHLKSHFPPLPSEEQPLLAHGPARIRVFAPPPTAHTRPRFNYVYDTMEIEQSDVGETISTRPPCQLPRQPLPPQVVAQVTPGNNISEHHHTTTVSTPQRSLFNTLVTILFMPFTSIFHGLCTGLIIISYYIFTTFIILLPPLLLITVLTSLLYHGGISSSFHILTSQGVWFFLYQHILVHFLGAHIICFVVISFSTIAGCLHALLFHPPNTAPNGGGNSSPIIPRSVVTAVCVLLLLVAMLPTPLQMFQPHDVLLHIPSMVFYWVLLIYFISLSSFLYGLFLLLHSTAMRGRASLRDDGPASSSTENTKQNSVERVDWTRHIAYSISFVFLLTIAIAFVVLSFTPFTIQVPPTTPATLVESVWALNRHTSSHLFIDPRLFAVYVPIFQSFSTIFLLYLLWRDYSYCEWYTSPIPPSPQDLTSYLTFFPSSCHFPHPTMGSPQSGVHMVGTDALTLLPLSFTSMFRRLFGSILRDNTSFLLIACSLVTSIVSHTHNRLGRGLSSPHTGTLPRDSGLPHLFSMLGLHHDLHTIQAVFSSVRFFVFSYYSIPMPLPTLIIVVMMTIVSVSCFLFSLIYCLKATRRLFTHPHSFHHPLSVDQVMRWILALFSLSPSTVFMVFAVSSMRLARLAWHLPQPSSALHGKPSDECYAIGSTDKDTPSGPRSNPNLHHDPPSSRSPQPHAKAEIFGRFIHHHNIPSDDDEDDS